MTTPKSTDDIVAAFPKKNLTAITGRPTFIKIFNLHSELKQNAVSVRSTLGGAAHGLLGLVMTNVAYNTLTGNNFIRPNEPAAAPVLAQPNPTAAQINLANREHALTIKTWQEMLNTDAALTQQIVNAIEPDYLTEASDLDVGFLNITTQDIITFLYERYGRISNAQILKNTEDMNKDWDIQTPISAMFRRIDKCMQYAELGGNSFTNEQVLTSALYLIQKTGEFREEIKGWRSRPAATKTWALFKPFFLEAYQQYEEDLEAGVGDTGYQAVNAITAELQDTITNLANATRNDQTTMSELKVANEKLQSDITKINDKLTKMATKLNTMSQLITSNNNNNNNGSNRRNGGNNQFDQTCTAYCHTHGRTYTPNHTSETCRFPLPNHQRNATLTNQMGGCTRGCNNNNNS
jgi:hypothetical protein